MKNFSPILVAILFCALSACNGKTEASISSTSQNGKVLVTISGKRSAALDPFKTEIVVKAYDFQEGKLQFEIMAGDLNQENVKFKWMDDNHCIIVIEETDKQVRSFQLIASQNQVQLAEI
jgi:hypothetical protein